MFFLLVELFGRNDIELDLLAELLPLIGVRLQRGWIEKGDVCPVNLGQQSRIKAIRWFEDTCKLCLS